MTHKKEIRETAILSEIKPFCYVREGIHDTGRLDLSYGTENKVKVETDYSSVRLCTGGPLTLSLSLQLSFRWGVLGKRMGLSSDQ